eukprot:6055668-Amphidinium_carterae.1
MEGLVAKYVALAVVLDHSMAVAWVDLDIFPLQDVSRHFINILAAQAVKEASSNSSGLTFARHILSESISSAVALALAI